MRPSRLGALHVCRIPCFALTPMARQESLLAIGIYRRPRRAITAPPLFTIRGQGVQRGGPSSICATCSQPNCSFPVLRIQILLLPPSRLAFSLSAILPRSFPLRLPLPCRRDPIRKSSCIIEAGCRRPRANTEPTPACGCLLPGDLGAESVTPQRSRLPIPNARVRESILAPACPALTAALAPSAPGQWPASSFWRLESSGSSRGKKRTGEAWQLCR